MPLPHLRNSSIRRRKPTYKNTHLRGSLLTPDKIIQRQKKNIIKGALNLNLLYINNILRKISLLDTTPNQLIVLNTK